MPDTAECNIPMSGARGRRLDAEITHNVRQQAQDRAASDKALLAKYRADRAQAKALLAQHESAILGVHDPKFGRANLKSALKSLSFEKLTRFVDKFLAEQGASS